MLKDKIRAALINKYKNLGFGDKAIDSVLAYLETTVTSEEQIEASVNAVEGLLKGFQVEIDRRVTEAARPKPAVDPAKGGDSAKADEPTPAPNPGGMPDWFKTYSDDVKKRLDAIETGKATDTRKARLEEKLTNVSPKFKERIMKDFARLPFKDDADFDTWLGEVETDAKDFVQEESNNGLRGQPRPAAAGGKNVKTDSKAESDALAKSLVKK